MRSDPAVASFGSNIPDPQSTRSNVMRTQHASRTGIVLIGGLAVAGLALAFGENNLGSAGQPPKAPAVPVGESQKAPEDRPADRAGVQKALDAFVAAFGKGDAKAVGAQFTADGEYISDDGTTYRGRAALEKDYAEFFAKNPTNALEVDVDSIRFPSRDTAVVEGHFKLHMGKK